MSVASDGSPALLDNAGIPRGFTDVAAMLGSGELGLKIFDNSWVAFPGDRSFNHNRDKNPYNLSERADGMSAAFMVHGDGDVWALVPEMPKGMLDWQAEHLGVVTERVIEVPMRLAEDSNSREINQEIVPKFLETAGSAFKNATFCSLHTPTETAQATLKFGARTLVTSELAAEEDSKINFVKRAAEDGYLVPPFVIADSIDELWDAVQKAMLIAKHESKHPPEETQLWVKFAQGAGGVGVRPIVPSKITKDELLLWAKATLEVCGTPDSLVVDMHVNDIRGVTDVEPHYTVHAVIGENTISLAGVTLSRTENGVYRGGSTLMTDAQRKAAEEVKKAALPIFRGMWGRGYRGFAGANMVRCTLSDGGHRVYALEVNPRLCCSTFTMFAAQMVERAARRDTLAVDRRIRLPHAIKDFRGIERIYGTILYSGGKSGYEGMIPTILAPDRLGGYLAHAKVILVAPNPERLERLERRLEELSKA
jgi:hypothetical protein